jgi:nicotinamidase-related amidase
MRILAADTMALVIDFQEKLMPVINHAEDVLHNSEILIRGLKILGVPLLATQQYTEGLGMTVNVIREVMGEDFTDYEKTTFSCADDAKIMTVIERMNRKNIIVCGVEAHICVLQTVIDLIEIGYNVILVTDCIGSRKEKDYEAAISRAVKEGAIPTTCEAILFELTRISQTSVFKEILNLIK